MEERSESSERLWGGLVYFSEPDVVRIVPEEYFVKQSSSEGTDIGTADNNRTWDLCRHQEYYYFQFLLLFYGYSEPHEESKTQGLSN